MLAVESTPDSWLDHEDTACREQRLGRLAWLCETSPPSEIWLFPGGEVSHRLFEEMRYCFVYGQFIATIVLGCAYVERTLAAWFYASGQDDLERASLHDLLDAANYQGLLSDDEHDAFDRMRKVRNPVTHFRSWARPDIVERRAISEDTDVENLLEADARIVIGTAMRMVARNAV